MFHVFRMIYGCDSELYNFPRVPTALVLLTFKACLAQSLLQGPAELEGEQPQKHNIRFGPPQPTADCLRGPARIALSARSGLLFDGPHS